MAKTIDELKSAAAVVRDATEEKENTALRIGQLFLDTIETLGDVSTNAIKGYVVISSTSDLPTSPTTEQQMKGYLLGTTLYVWVGTGGDTLDGKYQSAQLKGADGAPGEPGPKGDSGVDLGEVVLVNDLTIGGEASALSAEMGKVLNERTCPTATVSIPFDGGGRYIKADGSVAANNGKISTQYIPVNEGDEFVYSGLPGSNSRAVAGYNLVDGEYSFVQILLGTSTSVLTNKLIIIPAGITHILAIDSKSGVASLTTTKSSALSEISDDLGDIATTTLISNSEFTTGYIDKNGVIRTTAGEHALIDVKIGDEVCLYDYNAYGSAGETTIGKQLTETTFEPLLALESGTYNLVTYTATEDMVIGVSVYRSIRMLVVRRNRTTMWDATTEGLAQTREEIAQTNEWVDHYDMKLGYMFENIAVIGDSMARGTLGGESDPNLGGDNTGLSSHGASWLSCLAKRWGCKSKFHYTRSGTGCWSWLNNSFFGLGRFLTDIANGKIYNAYFIAYGHNDAPNAGVGTAEDEAAVVTFTDGQPSCPEIYTFCAYYKAIINQIRANAPHAMIFCLSEYDNVIKVKSNGVYRQAVIDVADWYYSNGDKLVHHLETGGVPYSGMDLGTHHSTVGYACIAKLVDNEVNRVIYQYREDIEIKYFGSYNTDHDAGSPWE